MKKRIAILSFSMISQDARILRQIQYLSEPFSLTVVGYGQIGSSSPGGVQMFSVPPSSGWVKRIWKWIVLIMGRFLGDSLYEFWYWSEPGHQRALEYVIRSAPGAIHANDWNTLPIAVKSAAKTGAKIVLDLHEYAPLEWENRRFWNFFKRPMVEYFLREHIPRISASVTVNETIAEKYKNEYGFRPVTVMNIPKSGKIQTLRATDPQAIKLIHHGGAIRDRRLELMIQMIPYLDVRYSLHLILIEIHPGYVSDLKNLAIKLGAERIFFHPPVPPAEIVDRLGDFDMGVFLLPSINFNYTAALPNKFFDFISAGLSVCIGPSPEMAQLTNQFGFGMVTASIEPKEVAILLNRLTAKDIDRMKQRALEAGKVLNGDNEMSKLVRLYDQLLNDASST